MTTKGNNTVDFGKVQIDEIKIIEEHRKARNIENRGDGAGNLKGLALSGGGIRSAILCARSAPEPGKKWNTEKSRLPLNRFRRRLYRLVAYLVSAQTLARFRRKNPLRHGRITFPFGERGKAPVQATET